MSLESPTQFINVQVPYSFVNRYIVETYGITDTKKKDGPERLITVSRDAANIFFDLNSDITLAEIMKQIGEDRFEIVLPSLERNEFLYRISGSWKGLSNIDPSFEGVGVSMNLIRVVNTFSQTDYYTYSWRFGFNEFAPKPYLVLLPPRKNEL